MAATRPARHGTDAEPRAQQGHWRCQAMKREEQLSPLHPDLLMCGCSPSGCQFLVTTGPITGLVEWWLVSVRKKRQKLLSVTLFFSTLISWIVIHDLCVFLNSEMG